MDFCLRAPEGEPPIGKGLRQASGPTLELLDVERGEKQRWRL